MSVSQVFFGSSFVDNDYWKEKREEFEKNGFVWIKKFYSPEQVELVKSWADASERDADVLMKLSQSSGFSLQELAKKMSGSLIVVPESSNPSQVCRVEDMLTCYPDLHSFVYGTLTRYLEAMLKEPYTLFKDKLNFKWPGGGAFPPHQDFPAFSGFGPREHISAMVCIDRATVENGCLYVAEKWTETFKGDENLDLSLYAKGMAVLPYNEGGKNHGSIKEEYVEKLNWVPILAEPGDVVFFNSYVPHYSEPNKSSSSRRAMFFTHSKLTDGEYREAYYHTKRNDPNNPLFHFATPTLIPAMD